MSELKRILHLEDEPDIREVTQLALEALGGFKTENCGSGEDALARAAGFRPDLLLLDVMMPGMNGPQTLEALRARPETADTLVIFMTAKVQAPELASFRALGAIGVVTKPFNPETLSDQVQQFWDAPRG